MFYVAVHCEVFRLTLFYHILRVWGGRNKQFVLILAIFIHQIFMCVMISYFTIISDVGHLICLLKLYKTTK